MLLDFPRRSAHAFFHAATLAGRRVAAEAATSVPAVGGGQRLRSAALKLVPADAHACSSNTGDDNTLTSVVFFLQVGPVNVLMWSAGAVAVSSYCSRRHRAPS